MNRQLGGKSGSEISEASPLSLLVHAADTQSQRPSLKGPSAESRKPEDHAMQRQAAARAEALQQQQGLLAQLRGSGLSEADILQHNAALVAAQQQQQAAALVLASDIRSAVAAAQIRQAAQLQNHDLILARAAAMQQQLGAWGSAGNEFQQELEFQRIEELERRQILAAASGAPLGALAARQQLELQEVQLRQEQLDRQLQQAGAGGETSILERAVIRPPVPEATAPAPPAVSADPPSTKDTFQKTPGSVVVPCRARGMPMDHNFKTAYFVIPENVEHGEELICSYFACRNAGIKFRYCTHCKVPVAKRNFRKRHKHGKTTTTNDAEDEQSHSGGEDETCVVASKPPRMKVEEVAAEPIEPRVKKEDVYCQEIKKARPELEMAAVDKLPKQSQPSLPRQPHIPHHLEAPPLQQPKAIKEPKPNKEPKVVSDDGDPPSVPSKQASGRSVVSAERERIWASLLAKRPPTKDGEAVSAWLMEVLSISDLDTPLKENGSSSNSVITALPSLRAPGMAPEAAAQVAAASKEWSGTNGMKRSKEADHIPSSQSLLIKKKRPLALLTKEEAPQRDEGAKKDVGSFAEWKDRKKHKGPKKGFSMQSE